jgi:hypothetical protein
MMITLSRKIRTEVGNWLYRNARAIDFTRWLYHFENGCPEAVISVLSKYQNRGGGFGYGLEADSPGPDSTSVQTLHATEIIREIRFFEFDHPVIAGILRYISGKTDDPDVSGNAPVCALAGFALVAAERNSELFDRCFFIAQNAIEKYMLDEAGNYTDMNFVACHVRLLEYCETAGMDGMTDLKELREKLYADITALIPADTGSWDAGEYFCRPSRFFDTPSSEFYEPNKRTADYECDFILKTRNPEGVWDIPRRRGVFPGEQAMSENRRKGHTAIRNMLYLKNFGMV